MPPIGPDKRPAGTSDAKSCSKVLSATISVRGNIKLPQKALEALGSKGGDPVELILGDKSLILLPATNRPSAYKRLFTLAAKALNGKKNAVLWLHASHFALGGRRPIDHMRSAKGAKDVEDLIFATEYGVEL
jgi:bifunctional DNA-binding transcriptional regulator/antitoxin component of YhaV-PrlF toxin-antitoxin module